ncbi:50S ribosomal protein L25 [Candidatus Berkelbacteria bacterium CG10_big_fil_rev_8_21_14_0_10_33_10]|uniref:Large ribosomal subunit protein bL25 n=1 Tax=Candidatus Berkelbacteria bacterium CG_4_10_14_0_2_um_filter_35_9_33_12 TaxID=1974499 RepID=A0A2M7W3I0_9BACT|nr:MAG: 50S ribosomal protein L25 [Candidatus Berkelbacteria bacterium CG23_combo_of_CG06-09_8_20_14_all_33_15]PIS08407.1 MAG: 50S ribosomal protein L25 [Candidatus Berkelbacteria bacterium CG10_big_fil_rev_8_21_14_0_10_33_10]PJA20083.1 MAG: 50S ribosomal protein L25 [Candidatus Berkelbacteria bacterium CG_4_10_14_0_2_um_filter_35_9_33_12]
MTNLDYCLKVEIRNKEKAKFLRAKGLTPLVLYGHGIKPISLSVKNTVFDKLFSEAGKSSIINLEINDGEKYKTIIHDVQFHPVSDNILHADIYKVSMKEKIETEIPIIFVGESRAVIELGGSLITNKSSLNISALPTDLIHEVEVDVSIIDNFEKQIHIQDIKLPDTIEILDDIEEVVAFVQEPRSEEELAELDEKIEEKIDEIEVEKHDKQDEEGSETETTDETKLNQQTKT